MSPAQSKANRLGGFRVERHLSQAQFARGVGVSRNRAVRIETRRSKASDEELDRFVAFLNKSGAKYELPPVAKADLNLEVLAASETFRVRASRAART